MWLVGVVVRRYIDILIIIITFPYSTYIIIGASLSEPNIYRTAGKILLIYTYRLSGVQFGSTKGPANMQHADVGPASKGSKVNNIALETTALVLRFSLKIGPCNGAAGLAMSN